MLLEALGWLTTPCARWPRRLGYLRESIATAARARRCARAWAPHLAASRTVILEQAGGGEALRVLGAGLAHDLPLAELAGRYRRLELVDWVFLRETRRLAARFANVVLLEADVTGAVPALARADSPEAVEAVLARPEPGDDPGLVLSLNLLSQLPLLPLALLARRFPGVEEARLNAWGLRLMERHLDRLKAAPAALLLADAVQRRYGAAGELVEETDFGAHFGYGRQARAAWDWELAPTGELAPGLRAVHRVVACRFPLLPLPEAGRGL